MMKLLVAVVCCVAAAITVVESATYTTKYDNVNLDEILSNERLVVSYFKCLMDTGKCTPEGEEIKLLLPEAIENKCEKCTEKQKLGSKKIIKFLYEKKNDMWQQLLNKYDSQGIFRERYREEAKTFNIEA